MITKLNTVPYKETGYFSDLIIDYIERNPKLNPFYGNFPDLEGFRKQIESKEKNFDHRFRSVLSARLLEQYQRMSLSEKTLKNIENLRSEQTFTVTTGHQLNIFTGPLYFLYKIATTVNLAKRLKRSFPDYDFVPVYWMATEDHDFEEIRFFNYKGKKIAWKSDQKGPVGRFSTAGMDAVYREFSQQLGKGKFADALRDLFQKAYLQHENLADATRFLANALFGDRGLVVVDGDDAELKRKFSPYVKEELLKNTFYHQVTASVQKLGKDYKIQVSPREINLFYLKNGLRERIVSESGVFKVLNTGIRFTEKEILHELEEHPERFSPNVLLRPLYEEVVLPNLCYIGGPAEVAYWMELKEAFEVVDVTFPVLLLRNSVLLINSKQYKKLIKLGVALEDVFLKKNDFINKKVKALSDISIDFSEQKKMIEGIFEHLEEISNCTDPSFIGAVKAQRQKQLNGLDLLEKRLLKAQKRKLNEVVERIAVLHHELFPNEKLQERYSNFSEFYENVGPELLAGLMQHLDPLAMEFDVLKTE